MSGFVHPAFAGDVIDAHVHLYDPASLDYPRVRELPVLNHRHAWDDFDADGGGGLAGLVCVEVRAAKGAHLAEADAMHSLVSRPGKGGVIVAYAPLDDEDQRAADFDHFASLPTMRGIRRIIEIEPDPTFCLEQQFVHGVRALASRNWLFELCIRTQHLSIAKRLVAACPDTMFVLDHMAKPDLAAPEAWLAWRDGITLLAKHDNVTCKISGIDCGRTSVADNVRATRRYVDHVIDRFGFDRVMYASNWPFSRLTHHHDMWVQTVTALLSETSPEEQAAFWAQPAKRIYAM